MSGLALKLHNVPVLSVPAPKAVAEFCACDLTCEYVETAFAKVGGSAHQKDYTSFLTARIAASDTITFRILKGGLDVATIVDSSYGDYYPTFSAQPLYAGFVVDWTLVYAAFSGGTYQIQIEKTILGSTSLIDSRKFRLIEYDATLANRTARIETLQTGNILSSEFDFTDLVTGGWPQSIRVPGKFGNKTPTLETDRFLDTSYREVQNRDEVIFTYDLRLWNVPQSIFNAIASTEVIANTIIVTDYDVQATAIYRAVPVVVDTFSEVNHFSNGHGNYTITCSDRVKNNIKRNY